MPILDAALRRGGPTRHILRCRCRTEPFCHNGESLFGTLSHGATYVSAYAFVLLVEEFLVLQMRWRFFFFLIVQGHPASSLNPIFHWPLNCHWHGCYPAERCFRSFLNHIRRNVCCLFAEPKCWCSHGSGCRLVLPCTGQAYQPVLFAWRGLATGTANTVDPTGRGAQNSLCTSTCWHSCGYGFHIWSFLAPVWVTWWRTLCLLVPSQGCLVGRQGWAEDSSYFCYVGWVVSGWF